MQYRKIFPDLLFDGYRLAPGRVLVITDRGEVEAVIAAEDAGEGVERVSGLLTPGFINCHCHLELSHMRGKIPEHTSLVDFVFKVVTERSAGVEEIQQAIALAEAEMKAAGIVAVGDICNNNSTLAQKRLGNLAYYNFIEASGWLPAVAEPRFERAKALFEAFAQPGESENPNAAIVPHAPYSVSNGLWQAIRPFFSGQVVSVHNQETPFEDEFFVSGTGDFRRMYELMNIDNAHHLPTAKSSLQSYFEKLLGAEKIILVHNTFTKKEDVDFVRRQTPNAKPPTFFCLCVNANQYIENALPPVDLLRQNECNIVLGTDSLASNWSLSILDELKTLRKNFPHIGLEEMLRWATLNGAQALNLQERFGSFEKGKKPGAVLINEEGLTVSRLLF